MTTTANPVIAAARWTSQGRKGGVYSDARGGDLSMALIDYVLPETGLTGDHVDDLM